MEVEALASSGWQIKQALDGLIYYYNPNTEEVSVTKPLALLPADQQSQERWVWVRDEVACWLPVRVVSEESETSLRVVLESGEQKTVTASKEEPLWDFKKDGVIGFDIPDDLVMLDELNEANLVHCLKKRYDSDSIYTWVGASQSVLVSINPFKQLPIYTLSTMEEHKQVPNNGIHAPHTFAIGAKAFNQLRLQGQNQAVLISGESGAGKTEATKQVLSYLAEVAGSDANVEQRILNANPVLEAYGNAKTLRNNNSSRFGRWMEIFIKERGVIVGASIENYLLEKVRVVQQSPGERSFHAFYQLLSSPEWSGPLGLTAPENLRYLTSSGCFEADGVDDVEEFKDVVGAFRQMGFPEEDVQFVFETAAAVLYCGGIDFEAAGEGSVIDGSTQAFLSKTAELLKVDESMLADCLCRRTITVRGESNNILLSVKDAMDSVDALAKHVYSRLFDWLVAQINASVRASGQTVSTKFVGILDIFGFEIFQTNSLEQLFINFTNEKLQQHFNRHTFKEEESVYLSEGVPYEAVPFIDNQPVLDTIEKKPQGLLCLLDDEVKLPEGSDGQWLSKAEDRHRRDGCMAIDRKGEATKGFFTVNLSCSSRLKTSWIDSGIAFAGLSLRWGSGLRREWLRGEKPRFPLHRSTGDIIAVIFSPDRRHISAASGEGCETSDNALSRVPKAALGAHGSRR